MKVGITLPNSIISPQRSMKNIWETTETILRANYSPVREQEISVSKHEDISVQSIQQVTSYRRSLSAYYIPH